MFKHVVTILFLCGLFSSPVLARPLNIVVSIAPQRYLVETIAGEHAAVSVLIAPGQTPATWDPSPQSMVALAAADLLIPIGVPFESSWLPRLQSMFPDLKIADALAGISLQPIEAHDHEGEEHHHDPDHEMMDPHIWLDPLRCLTLGENIASALGALDPQHQQDYVQGLAQLREQLLAAHHQAETTLRPFQGRYFMVFHPSWGYFAARYQLHQLAIESSGKEPSGAQLAETAELARQHDVKVIFIQEQFSRKAAVAIANQVQAKVVSLDPLTENIPAAIQDTADKIKTALETPWAQPSH